MAGGFASTPDVMVAAAGRFARAGDDLGRALDELRATLEGLGDVCGDDDQGRAFAATYVPAAQDADRALAAVARAVASVGPALTAAAGQYRRGDAAVGEALGGDPR